MRNVFGCYLARASRQMRDFSGETLAAAASPTALASRYNRVSFAKSAACVGVLDAVVIDLSNCIAQKDMMTKVNAMKARIEQAVGVPDNEDGFQGFVHRGKSTKQDIQNDLKRSFALLEALIVSHFDGVMPILGQVVLSGEKLDVKIDLGRARQDAKDELLGRLESYKASTVQTYQEALEAFPNTGAVDFVIA
jgi:hypothetical protein